MSKLVNNKRKFMIFIIITLMVTVTAVFALWRKSAASEVDIANEGEFFEDVRKVSDIIGKDSHTYDYSKYVKVSLGDAKFVYNKTTEEGIKDDDFCTMIYKVVVENVSEETITVSFRFFTPRELSSTILVGSPYIGPFRDYKLKPHANVDNEFGITMKHTNKLTDKEKKLLEDYGGTIFVELKINGKTYYGKVKK